MAIDLSKDIVLRWEEQDPALAPLLHEGGADVILAPDPKPEFKEACAAQGMRVEPADAVKLGGMPEFLAAGNAPVAFEAGNWPGIGKMPEHDADWASASRQPWVDANGFRVACLRAVAPGKPAVLGYSPNEAAGVKPDRMVPYESLELALAEAWVNGGNYILAVPERYRSNLLRKEEKALTAWRKLGQTAGWLKQNRALLGRPVFPCITLLVDDTDATAELANLIVRQNASPCIESALAPPAPDPAHRLVVCAASIKAPAAAVRDKLLAHASAGSILVTDREGPGSWWAVPQLVLERDEPDRETYKLGKGKVVAYKEVVADPSDFALDLIDLATHPRRAVRMWNAFTSIATMAAAPAQSGRALLYFLNYGQRLEWDTLIYAQGNYARATLLRPGQEPQELKTAKRETRTEINISKIDRLAVVVFS